MKDQYLMKCKDLKPRLSKVSLEVHILSKEEVKDVKSKKDRTSHKMTEALVGDETGTILLTLWDDNVGQVEAGRNYFLSNCYITLFKGSMRLNLGKFGEIKAIDKNIEANSKNNMSEKVFEEPRRISDYDKFSSGSFWPD